ncbi:hypothetical protein [Pseudorhodoferax sp. Leaf267]|uniref:hypothetical protein n=1 Tax=Pseudorhodoferax sp. Leaf267 TaxID=1736316 RepID=UPI0006F29A75|nr:hypothetical protein [Pseudorhodoferax sp. Leaf267]KQP11966.1 hypothetical protein ASF43_23780 [Pseudorhodoferax sp. Leaf267]
MRKNRHTLARFEEHSLALFTALVMGSSGVAAQTQTAAEGSMVHAQATVPVSRPVTPVVQRNASAEQAFGRADSNGDGQLSRDEAQRLPAIWERFDDIDANKDRMLSRDEFHRGIAN